MEIAFSAANWLLNDNNEEASDKKNEMASESEEKKEEVAQQLDVVSSILKIIVGDDDEDNNEDADSKTTTTDTLSLPDSLKAMDGDDEMDSNNSDSGVASMEETSKEKKLAEPSPPPMAAKVPATTGGDDNDDGGGDGGAENNGGQCREMPTPARRFIPLLDYLCRLYGCNVQELQCLLFHPEMRRRMIEELRQNCELRTNHLHPATRNMELRCDDFTCQCAQNVLAFNGFLNITVRQYYYTKHKVILRHPYFPCLIVFGGGNHRSYYPLEVVSVHRRSKLNK